MTHAAPAMKLAKSEKANRWKIGHELMLMESAGEMSIREFALLCDGHASHEQSYSNWRTANVFAEAMRQGHERELAQLTAANLTDISYYNAAGRYHALGGDMEHCIELLQDCVISIGKSKGVRWLDGKIAEALGKVATSEQRMSKLRGAIHGFLYGGDLPKEWPSGLIAALRAIYTTWFKEVAG